tara:strand:- start:918 stop:2000 length:1083 start_codon:yes stop_codon:yes gene_type:complete
MKIYKAAIIGLGPSGLAVNKLIFDNHKSEIIAFETTSIENRNNFFGFWLTEWMRPFENLIEKKWNNWIISNKDKQIIHNDENFPYCVMSFKVWKEYCLNTKNKLKIKNKKVINYNKIENYFKITTEDQQEYFAEKIYDSRSVKEKNGELIQHFFGINITTEKNIFDDTKVTLMHFTKEEDVLHFIYLLPFSKNKALIESTVFSKKVQNESWYRQRIHNYLKEIAINEYEEDGYEKGIIPMFFAQSKTPYDKNIINIGIRAGACKPSTGYAFSFLIKQIQLLKNSNKNHVEVHNLVERKMDGIFLNYLKNNNEDGSSFINLANNLNGNEFKNFMMGESSVLTKLKIVKSMPILPFIKSIIK